MSVRKLHEIWMEQCDAARGIKLRYGLKAAFDYLVAEKLLNFASVAAEHPEFARELPRFVSQVRIMFTPRRYGHTSRGSSVQCMTQRMTMTCFGKAQRQSQSGLRSSPPSRNY